MFLSLPFFPWCKCNVLLSYLCPNFLINNVLILMVWVYNISFCTIYSGLLKRTQFSWNVTTSNAAPIWPVETSLGSWCGCRIFIIHQDMLYFTHTGTHKCSLCFVCTPCTIFKSCFREGRHTSVKSLNSEQKWCSPTETKQSKTNETRLKVSEPDC